MIVLSKTSAMATSNPLTKIGRQLDRTWCRLQKRLSDNSFDYSKFMPENIFSFIKHKATSVNSCIGYFVPTLLTTVSYLLTKAKVTISTVNHVQPTNLYTIFVGYPGTGKSSAIDDGCIKPVENTLQADVKGCLLDRTNSSGLIKHLSKNGTAFIVSSEVSDVLNKLLKSDEETCSGELWFCVRFSRANEFHFTSPRKTQGKSMQIHHSPSLVVPKCRTPRNLSLEWTKGKDLWIAF